MNVLSLVVTRVVFHAGGRVSMDTLANVYNARDHPDVKSRKRTEADVLREFLNGFASTRMPGFVSFAEFERYFARNSVRVF